MNLNVASGTIVCGQYGRARMGSTRGNCGWSGPSRRRIEAAVALQTNRALLRSAVCEAQPRHGQLYARILPQRDCADTQNAAQADVTAVSLRDCEGFRELLHARTGSSPPTPVGLIHLLYSDGTRVCTCACAVASSI